MLQDIPLIRLNDMRLPNSLPPQLLGEILGYEPRFWHKIEPSLLREFPDDWEKRTLSDESFYDHLHNFLQDPERRALFNSTASKHGTKKRPLELYKRIDAYYKRRHLKSPDFLKKWPKTPTYVDVLNILAEDDDIDQLANMAWAFLDKGCVDIKVVQEIADKREGLIDRIGFDLIIEADDNEQGQWQSMVVDLRALVDELNSKQSNVELADKIRELANSAVAVAESIRDGFWNKLTSLLTEYEDCFAGSPELSDIRNELANDNRRKVIPANSDSILFDIRKELVSLLSEINYIRKESSELSLAPLNKLEGLVEKFSLSEQRRQDLSNLLKAKLEDLVRERLDEAIDSEENTDNSGESGDASENFCTDEGSDTRALDGNPETTPKETANDIESRADVTNLSKTNSEPAIPAETSGTVIHEAHEETTKRKRRSVDKDTISSQPPEVTAFDLMNNLLDKGEFAHAYWLAYTSGGAIDPNILGVLCEGSHVKLGFLSPGRLSYFLDELTTRTEWTDDEYLLLAAAILQPILFLRPLPPALYLVINALTSGVTTPLSDLIKHLRDTCLNQGITMGNINQGEVDVRIVQHSDMASEFLSRVPSIRFNYRPAMSALRTLYKTGSKLHRLHTLIANDDRKRRREVEALCKELNPRNIVANLQNKAQGIKAEFTGHTREKLVRHLYDSISLGNAWIADLAEVPNQEGPQGDLLRREVIARLTKVRKSLEGWESSAVTRAVMRRISDLLNALDGKDAATTGIVDACIDLPGILLDGEMVPVEESYGNFVEAIERLTAGDSNPDDVFDECLKRDELSRATLLIEKHSLGVGAIHRLEQHRVMRCQELRAHIEELQPKVEEAYLLGQLWNVSENEDEMLDRSDLMSRISEGWAMLDSGDSELNINISMVSTLVGEIEDRITAKVRDRTFWLNDEKERVVSQFPETERGKDDSQYFETELSESMRLEDHVGAFDLLARAREAVSQGVRIARSPSTAPSENFTQFLNRAEEYRDGIAVNGLTRYVNSIQQGEETHGIRFDLTDESHREESVSVLHSWQGLRDRTAYAEETDALDKRSAVTDKRLAEHDKKLAQHVNDICRFAGFHVSHSPQFVTTNDGLFHVKVPLDSGPLSPLPGFGSNLVLSNHREERVNNSLIDVVVSKRSHNPDEIMEFLKRVGIGDKAVLVLLTRQVSMKFRLKWQQVCALMQMMALPLDSCLLLHLCGERNRLKTLFEIGLPFTWALPYIPKGETVAKEMFVGRKKEARDLVDVKGSCIVFGGRQLGKSALLTHIRRENHNPDEGLFISYLDVDDLGIAPQKSAEMIQVFWQRVSEHLVRLGAIGELDPGVKSRSRWKEAVPSAIVTALNTDPGKRIVLLLDETDDLLDLDSASDFKLVRRLRGLMAETGQRFKVVLAGLQSVQRYIRWENHPFAQLGKEIVVDPLPPMDAQELIIRPFQALGFEFENAGLVRRILSLTNYHPGLIQIFCYRLLKDIYGHWQQKLAESPIREVTADDVYTVEQNDTFREDVRNRFDWTLDLDERYKVITYGLVLSPEPTEAKTVSQFKELGSEWWPQVFDNSRMDNLAMQALLDEMVGLGVLIPERRGQLQRYRLRSPNLLRLLGPREVIDKELEWIMSLEGKSRPDPRHFHEPVDKSDQFGPLDQEAVSCISDPSAVFSLDIVLGSPIMGIHQVAAHVRKVMDDLANAEGKPVEDLNWKEIRIPRTIHTTDRIIKRLKDQLSPKDRGHRYAIIVFGEYLIDEDLGEFMNKLVKDLSKVCRRKSRGKVVVVLGTQQVWDWTCSKIHPTLRNNPRVKTVMLRRWTDGAVTNALDRIGLRTDSKMAGSEVCGVTDGVHQLVSKTLAQSAAAGGSSARQSIEISGQVLTEFTLMDREQRLEQLGMDDSPLLEATIQLLSLLEEKKGSPILTETSFELAIEGLPEKSPARQLLLEKGTELREWLGDMDVIWPTSDGAYYLSPFMSEFVALVGSKIDFASS